MAPTRRAAAKKASQAVKPRTTGAKAAKPTGGGNPAPEVPVVTSSDRKRKAASSTAAAGKTSVAAPAQEPATKRYKVARDAKPKNRPPAINEVPDVPLTVFVFGGGENGELGLGPKQTASTRPRKNPFLDPSQEAGLRITAIACGGMHTVALTSDNKIVTWGVNDNDALGRDTKWDGGMRDLEQESSDEDGELNPLESTPTAISPEHFDSDTEFANVAAGDSCSFALTTTGRVYGWGTFRDPNGDESFGYSDAGGVIKRQATPMLIAGLENIKQIACGANHALALDKAGNIWGWGSGHQNQLGRRLFGRHQDTLRPQIVRVCRGSAKYVACGEYHCFAVDKRDNVWGWGLNSFGEAGDAKTAGGNSTLLPHPVKIPALCGKKVTAMAGGAHHSAAVTSSGDCLVWGRLDGGQLGMNFSAAQAADEKLIRCDERGKPRICLVPTAVPGLGPVAHVGCGTDHTLFVKRDGSVYSTGFGSEGQLGLGTEDDVEVAQKIEGKSVKDYTLTWAGAGGQFSITAGTAVTASRGS